MAISRMQNPQQLQGIGSLRQPYGLGKLVKKAFKGVKKIAKSPLGKAALLYAGTAGLGSIGSGLTGWQRFAPSNFMGNLGRIGGFLTGKGGAAKTGLGKWWGGLSGGQKIFTGLGGAAIAAPFIQKALGYGPYQDDEGEEELSWTQTPQSILDIRNMARNRDSSLAFLPSSNYAQSGFYAADGGRAGLVNGGEAGQAQMEQMLRAEYLKYRNQGGTMPYEQFKILVMKQAQQGQTPTQMMAADGGRAGYFLGKKVGYARADPNRVVPAGDLKSNMLNLFSNKLSGKNRVTPVSNTPMNQGNSFMGSMTSRAFQGEDGDYAEYLESGSSLPYQIWKASRGAAADGGRAGYQGGELVEQETDLIEGPQGGEEFQETVVEGQEQPSREQLEALAIEIFQLPLEELDDEQLLVVYQEAMQGQPMEEAVQEEDVQFAANGGVMGGDDDELTYNPYQAMDMYKRTRKQEGGLMDLQGQEKDYRDEGGFVALGGEERADDVPARLSKNEFVFTADAVRAAGGGDIDKGSEVMQNVMDNLEQGGEVSEDSQGLEGGEEIMSEEIIDEANPAQGMFDNYEQLQSRVG